MQTPPPTAPSTPAGLLSGATSANTPVCAVAYSQFWSDPRLALHCTAAACVLSMAQNDVTVALAVSLRPARSLAGAPCNSVIEQACVPAKAELQAAFAPGIPSVRLKLKRPLVVGRAPWTSTGGAIGPPHVGSAAPPLQTSFAPVPPAMDFQVQPLKVEQKDESKPVVESVIRNWVRAVPLAAPVCERMSIGVSPRPLATSFTSLVGLIAATLVSPKPFGAVLFTYLATVGLFTTQWPMATGARNAPEVEESTPLSYVTSSDAPMVVWSFPVPLSMSASLATNTTLAPFT